MNRRIIGLPGIFLLVLILLIIISALARQSGSEKQAAQKYLHNIQAFWLTEAGVEQARNQLAQDWLNRNSPGVTALGPGTYDFAVYATDSSGSPLPADQLRITVTGTVGNAVRQIEVLLEDRPDDPAAAGKAGFTPHKDQFNVLYWRERQNPYPLQ